LDYLSRAHKVMFVIAAGNIDQPPSAPPQHYLPETSRLLAPGEALLPITVGSIAKVCENGCVAVENEVVGYSRRGPGADGGVKPELAMHGGNAIYTGVGWTTSPRVGAYGLGRSGTHLEYALGTSYSAPLVAQFAARLFDAYPQASPNLVKALLCHFVQECTAPQPGGATEGRDYFGFGEPVIERALHSAQYSCTYIFTGRVNADTYLFIPFHVPEALVGQRRSRLGIRGTIVFDPPVSRDDSTNYSQCRVSGLMRKRGEEGMMDVTIGGGEDDTRVPWNSVLQFWKGFRRPYESGEWELRLRLDTRGALAADFEQDVAVVIEVIDLNEIVDVRSAVESEAPTIYLPVELKEAA
jgi:hypothetical protein